MTEAKVIDFGFTVGGKSTDVNLIHTVRQIKGGRYKMTGYTKLPVNIGDEIKVLYFGRTVFSRVQFVGRRNHRGRFENPQDSVGTFFGAVTIAQEKTQIGK